MREYVPMAAYVAILIAVSSFTLADPYGDGASPALTSGEIVALQAPALPGDPSPWPTSTPTAIVTPTATPVPPIPPTPVPQPSGARSEMLPSDQAGEKAVLFALANAGVPSDLWPEFVSVAWKESKWSPDAVSPDGCCVGVFQLHAATWGPFCGVTREQLFDMQTNVACAYMVYRYDIDRGYSPWSQWSTKP